jgi:predicted nucleic acid-binding protein
MRELADVLRNDLKWLEPEIIAQLKLIARVAVIVSPDSELQAVTKDPDDDRILECALDGKADLVVSGDKHLTRLKSFRGIAIVRPADFMRLFE